jgi:hypothetical protein
VEIYFAQSTAPITLDWIRTPNSMLRVFCREDVMDVWTSFKTEITIEAAAEVAALKWIVQRRQTVDRIQEVA